MFTIWKEEALDHIIRGNLVIFIDGWDKAISYKSGGLETRQVSESLSEPVVQGPRESTVENLKKNIGLLRERLKSPHFKIDTLSFAGETKTTIAYGYLEGTVNPEMLAEFQRRIGRLNQGEILETS